MQGLTQGEQSTLANPRLQLICRSGGYLADLVSGSVLIQDVRAHASAVAVKVAAAAIVPATQKVGTGRYAILTGNTTAWSIGTYRAVCTYVMTAGGPTYTQVIEFEILSATDWPDGSDYSGYLSTRRAYQDSYAASTVARETLHRHIDEQSKRIDMMTGRIFSPRYLRMKVGGQEASKLLLNLPVIAIEDIYAVWQTTTGQDSYKFEQYLYKVYNRHLDGYATEQDDRYLPFIELTDVDGTVVKANDNWAWPYGNQNIEVRGVFGYTDPVFDPNNGQVLIGNTPAGIVRATGALVTRAIADPTLSNAYTWASGSARSWRTRDQSLTLGGGSGGSSGGGGNAAELTGDALIDSLLLRYCRPAAFGAV
jgi:uncharacterized membrane protein YgcG